MSNAPIVFKVNGTMEADGGVRIGRSRAMGGPVSLSATPGVDVVKLQIENGPELVLHPETARLLLTAGQPKSTSRGAGGAVKDNEVVVGETLSWGGQAGPASRGVLEAIGGVVLSGLKVVAVKFTSAAIKRKIDPDQDQVFQLDRTHLEKLDKVAQVPGGGKTSLVFIHGTFSSIEGGYGKLWSEHPDRVAQLFTHFESRVYGFQHATVGRSPVQNALAFVNGCDKGATVHLITHSRGGLVAEVLVRAAAPEAGTGLPKTDPDSALYPQLVDAIRKKALTIEKVVRVACPARGTLLASGRLDAYLSILKWGMQAAGVPVLPSLVDFLAGVAKERLDPSVFPGLAAMVPDSPLIRWLHGATRPVESELRVVAGDIQGDSVSSWAKTLTADALFWTDNDLVVHTSSMYGGVPRTQTATFVLDRGGDVDHFRYFANDYTAGAIVDVLIEPKPTGWTPIGPQSYQGGSSTGSRGVTPQVDDRVSVRPLVFLLPGILGAELTQGDGLVWIGPGLLGGFDRLAMGADDVQVGHALPLFYAGLEAHLLRTHDVVTVPYDWRLPIEASAKDLAKRVAERLANRPADQPVRFVAHSMGGLVVRTLALDHPKLWASIWKRDGSRVLMLGTPNQGTYTPMQVLSGDDDLGNLLGALGAPLRGAEARQILADMPGFLQLQADLPDQLDSVAKWQALAEADAAAAQGLSAWHRWEAGRWGIPSAAALKAAVALRRRLDAQLTEGLGAPPGGVVMVLGSAPATAEGIRDPTEAGSQEFHYLDTSAGDGRVTHARARLPGVPAWITAAPHSFLAADSSAFPAYEELLERGTTARLDEVPAGALPAQTSSRPGRESTSGPPPSPPAGADGPRRGGAGGGGGASLGRRLDLAVRNASLASVNQPLLLGHYLSSRLTGTEGFVDKLMDGELGRSLKAGTYPGPTKTAAVFVRGAHQADERSVLIVGLGLEGSLFVPDLQESVRCGVLKLSQRLAEDGDPVRPLELCATLLGSGGVGISPGQAAVAIARGVSQANLEIRHSRRGAAAGRWPAVERLILVEVYHNRACEAWTELRALGEASPASFRVAPTVEVGKGAASRPAEGGYRGTSSDLIRVTCRKGTEGGDRPEFEFSVDSRRARTEVRATSPQPHLVQSLVTRASTAGTASDFARALFHLLVPTDLEAYLAGSSELVLEVDAVTGAVPWEILDTRPLRTDDPDDDPWSVRTRLIRRLRTEQYRVRPDDATRDAGILIVGDPRVDDRRYPPLPAALNEARTVERAVRSSGRIGAPSVLVGESPGDGPVAADIIRELLARTWRVVHIAGHGEHPNGVVLSDGVFLGANEIQAMRHVPELVFVNCCHLGSLAATRSGRRTEAARKAQVDHPTFASGVAAALIQLGVRCVVAAGWAVDDVAASTFARVFYERLLAGKRFAVAVGDARDEAHRLGGNTWAAYQCYGDPDWTLTDGTEAKKPLPSQEAGELATAEALVVLLDSVTAGLRAGTVDLLEYLEARHGADWGRQGRVAEAFARAWAATKVDDTQPKGNRRKVEPLRRAHEWYHAAAKSPDGSASGVAEEQAANLEVRLGWSDFDAVEAPTEADAERAREAIRVGLRELEGIRERRPSMEVWSMIGSASKRLVLVDQKVGSDASENLAKMKSAYEAALVAPAPTDNRFYPRMNLVAAYAASREPVPAKLLEAAHRDAVSAAANARDFWIHVAPVELEFYAAASAGKLSPTAAATFRGRFTEARKHGGSVREWTSVLETTEFVLGGVAAGGAGWAETAERLQSVLTTIREYAALS